MDMCQSVVMVIAVEGRQDTLISSHVVRKHSVLKDLRAHGNSFFYRTIEALSHCVDRSEVGLIED